MEENEALRHAVDRVLAEATQHKDEFPDAVNWADLRCVEVLPLEDGSWVASVEEADPDAWHLQLWIEKRLKAFGVVHVATEW